MARSRKRSVMEKKAKKKIWVPVVAPELFNKAVIGEIPLTAPKTAVGRVVNANLMNITHDIKQQNINIDLRVKEVRENQAFTEITGFKVMPAAIKRMTHRRIDVIEDSSIYVTKDKVRVRIKPMLFTRGNTSNAVQSALRKGMKNIVLKNVKKARAQELFRDALSNKLQYAITKELSKLYPLKRCVIRELRIEKETARKKGRAVTREEKIPETRKGKKAEGAIDEKKAEEPVLVPVGPAPEKEEKQEEAPGFEGKPEE